MLVGVFLLLFSVICGNIVLMFVLMCVFVFDSVVCNCVRFRFVCRLLDSDIVISDVMFVVCDIFVGWLLLVVLMCFVI